MDEHLALDDGLARLRVMVLRVGPPRQVEVFPGVVEENREELEKQRLEKNEMRIHLEKARELAGKVPKLLQQQKEKDDAVKGIQGKAFKCGGQRMGPVDALSARGAQVQKRRPSKCL